MFRMLLVPVGSGAAKKMRVDLARQTLARHEQRKRRHRVDSANLKRRQEKEGRYERIRKFAEAQIAKDPSLRPLTQHALAQKIKAKWNRVAKHPVDQIGDRTIRRALGPAREWAKKS
jgi:hypothetical protein